MSKNDFIMKPKVDFCFKALMEEADIRRGFLAAVLGLHPDEIADSTLLPTIMEKETADGKRGVLDVRILLRNRVQINIEIQVSPYEYWQERSLFYWSKMYIDQIHEGDDYDVLKRCIHVGILDFELFKNHKNFYSQFQLRESTEGFLYSDIMEIHTLELPKLSKYEYPETELLRWSRFLNAERKEEFEMIAKDDDYIQKAYDRLINLSADDRKRMAYEQRQKDIRDYNSFMHYNMKKGLEQGLEQGQQLIIISQISKKLKKGKTPETIADELELDLATVQTICDVASKYAPDYDCDSILQEMQGNK